MKKLIRKKMFFIRISVVIILIVFPLCFLNVSAVADTYNIYTAKKEGQEEEVVEKTSNDNPQTGGYTPPQDTIMMAVDSNTFDVSAAAQAGLSSIKIITPSMTNKTVASITLEVTPAPMELYYRLNDKDEWKPVENIINPSFQITQNTFVYTKAIDANGLENFKSEYVECFDRQAPTFTTAFQSDNRITITARDDLSGVKAIYINDDVIYSEDFYNTSDNGCLITYVHSMGNADTIVVQIEDNTGNFSRSTTVNSKKTTSSESSNTTTTEDKGNIGNAKITIIPPDWTNTKEALVKIQVDGENIKTVQAKIGRDGTWFTVGETMDFKITQNSEIYVKALDTSGRATVTSAAIFCFDYNPPIVKAVQDEDVVNITVEDDLSGVSYVYVNGKPYVPDGAGGVSVSVDGKSSFVIQAKDNAHNISKALTIAPDGVSGGQAVDGDPQSNTGGTTYIINIGDGQYTVEELLKLGLPIYIFPEADDETIRAILYARGDEIYKDNTGIVLERHMIYQEAFDARGNRFWIDRKGNFILFDKDGSPLQWDGDFTGRDWYDIDGNLIQWDDNGLQIISKNNLINTIVGTDEDGIESIDPTVKKKKSNVGDVLLYALFIVGAGILGFLFFVKKKEKESFSDDDMYETDEETDSESYSDFEKFDETLYETTENEDYTDY